MKRRPPSGISVLWTMFIRFLRKHTIGLHHGPGEHSCWSCKLYNTKIHACTILVDRGRYAPRDPTGIRITELRRVWPFDLCVRLLDMEMGRIIILDKDSPEHASGKRHMAELEDDAKKSIGENMDEQLLNVVNSSRSGKTIRKSVSNKDFGSRGDDPWLSSSAKDAGGQPPTSRR